MTVVTDWLASNAGWLAIVVSLVLAIATWAVPDIAAKRRLRLDLEILHLIRETQLAPPMTFSRDLQKQLEAVLRQRTKRWGNWRRGFRRGQFLTLALGAALFWVASLRWHAKDAAFWIPFVLGAYLIVAVIHDFIWLSWDRYRLSVVGQYVEDKFLLPGDYRWVRTITIMRREQP